MHFNRNGLLRSVFLACLVHVTAVRPMNHPNYHWSTDPEDVASEMERSELEQQVGRSSNNYHETGYGQRATRLSRRRIGPSRLNPSQANFQPEQSTSSSSLEAEVNRLQTSFSRIGLEPTVTSGEGSVEEAPKAPWELINHFSTRLDGCTDKTTSRKKNRVKPQRLQLFLGAVWEELDIRLQLHRFKPTRSQLSASQKLFFDWLDKLLTEFHSAEPPRVFEDEESGQLAGNIMRYLDGTLAAGEMVHRGLRDELLALYCKEKGDLWPVFGIPESHT